LVDATDKGPEKMFSGQGTVIIVVFGGPRYRKFTILGDDGVEIDQERKATITDCAALVALPKKHSSRKIERNFRF
jgi:hypothetical protein